MPLTTLVVDIGAHCTGAAVVVGEGREGYAILLRDPHSGAALWPSRLSADGGVFWAGSAAEPVRSVNLRDVLDGPRWAPGSEAPIRLGEQELPPISVLSLFLGVLRAEALRILTTGGRPVQPPSAGIDRLTVVVPTWYQAADHRRDLLIAAGEAAGFSEVELVDSAVALLLDYQFAGAGLDGRDGQAVPLPAQSSGPRLPDGSLVLVCDLGETWSTALLRADRHEALPLAHESTGAGRELDQRLLADVRAQTGDWLDQRLARPGDEGWWAHHQAMEFLRHMKHALGQREPAAEVSGRPAAEAPSYTLVGARLDRLAEPGLRWLGASSRSLVARLAAGLAGTALGRPSGFETPNATVADVQAVLLAGGHARLAVAERILREELGRPVIRLNDPDLAAVRGAVRFVAGAASRRISADHPRWRVQPWAWEVPTGRATLERWLVGTDEPYQRGAVLAQVRTADERVYELTAADDGMLLTRPGQVGDVVGPILVAAAKRPASLLSGDPPGLRHELSGTGEWLFIPDRKVLVECAATADLVRLWSVPDGIVLREFRPAFDDPSGRGPGIQNGAHRSGRVFVHPGGRLALVAWDRTGTFWVWDLHSGVRTTAFRDPSQPTSVLVNEREWRLSTQGEDSGSAGRYRRSIATVWDLATGKKLEKLTDDWQRRLVGYQNRSVTDRFGEAALSPDGRLRAVPVVTPAGLTGVSLRMAGSEQEIFRREHPPSARVRVAFSADGQFLLANRESGQDSRVEVWEL